MGVARTESGFARSEEGFAHAQAGVAGAEAGFAGGYGSVFRFFLPDAPNKTPDFSL